MGYVDENLVTGETVAYRGDLHWIVLLRPVLIALVLCVPAVVLLYAAASGAGGLPADPSSKMALVVAGLFLLLVGAIFIAVGVARRKAAEFAVTNKRVILKRGIWQRRTEEIFLQRIESVGVAQDVLGRVLNYGTITVRGIGGTLEPFSHVSNALEFRRRVQDAIAKASPG